MICLYSLDLKRLGFCFLPGRREDGKGKLADYCIKRVNDPKELELQTGRYSKIQKNGFKKVTYFLFLFKK